jgi:hypothetical protein
MKHDGRYILQIRHLVTGDPDGLYVKDVEVHLSETVNSHFTFTDKLEEARVFSYDDLWSPLNVHGIGTEFTAGFAGGRAIKI